MTRPATGFRALVFVAGGLLLATFGATDRVDAAGTTSLALSAGPDSWYWPGLVAYLTPTDGTFTAQKNSWNGVSIQFEGPEPQQFWHLDFAAPGRQPLTPGLYQGAGNYPVQPSGRPGLNVAGEGLGCGASGSFEVLEIAYGSGSAILSFHARFEQRCEFNGSLLVGDVRYAAGGVVSIAGPLAPIAEVTRPLSFDVRALSDDPGPLQVTAPVVPDGASFSETGGGSGIFSWTPGFDVIGAQPARFEARTSGGTEAEPLTTRVEVVGISSLRFESEPGDPIGIGSRLFGTTATGVFLAQNVGNAVRIWYTDEVAFPVALTFSAPSGALNPGVYEGAMAFPDPGHPGLQVQAGGNCSFADGRFEVKQIRRDAFGEVAGFWADFEQRCTGAAGGLRGEIRYRADLPVLVRAPERLVREARAPMAFGVEGFAHAGRKTALAVEGLPSGARFEDREDGTGRFAWTPGALDAGRYRMTFRAAEEGGPTDVAWTDLDIRLAHDDFDGAFVIPSLPFHDAATTLTATRAIDDPSCDTYDATVWYAFTPATDLILVGSTAGSDYRTSLSAYAGPHPFPEPLVCAFDDLVVEARAGTTYFFMVNGREGGGHLAFSLAGYAPLEVGLTLDPGGRLEPRSGAVTVGGTLTCSRPAQVVLDVAVSQSPDGRVASPHRPSGPPDTQRATPVTVDCAGETRWSATLSGESRRMHRGAATLLVEGSAIDDLTHRPAATAAAASITLESMAPGRR